MPTGYTANLHDGKEESLRDFLLHLARGMGAYIHQRDEDGSTPPKRRTVDEYYFNSVKGAQDRLDRLMGMDEFEQRMAYQKAEKEYNAENAEASMRDKAVAERYDARIAEVARLEFPRDDDETEEFFAGLRKFALDQLTESRKFDVHSRPYPAFKELYPTVESWYNQKVESAASSLAYAADSLKKEISRCRKVNNITDRLYKWVDEFGE